MSLRAAAEEFTDDRAGVALYRRGSSTAGHMPSGLVGTPMEEAFAAKLLLALVVCVLAGSAGPGHPRAPLAPEPLAAFELAERTPPLSDSLAHLLESRHSSWQPYRAATGELVHIEVSGSYAGGESIGQRWADFFADLLHGDELQLLHALIAPLPRCKHCADGARWVATATTSSS